MEGVEVPQVELSQEGYNAEVALSLMDSFPQLQKAEGMKELIDLVKEPTPKVVAPKEEVKEEVKGEKPAEETPATAVVEDDDEEVEGESVLFSKQAKKYAFKDESEAMEAFKKKFNITDVNSFGKVLKGLDESRKAAQKLPELESKLSEVDKYFQSLPPELAQSLFAFGKNEDYIKAFEQTVRQPDFSKPAEAHDAIKLIEYYKPGKFSQEDLTEFKSDPDSYPAISALYEFIKSDLYPNSQELVKSKRAAFEQSAAKRLEAINASIDSSVEHHLKLFPDTDDRKLNKVKKTLAASDDQKILGFFKNPDGTYRPEAVENLIMLEYGKTEVNALKKLIKEQNKSTEMAVNAKTKTPESGAGTNPIDQQRYEEARQTLNQFAPGYDPYKPKK